MRRALSGVFRLGWRTVVAVRRQILKTSFAADCEFGGGVQFLENARIVNAQSRREAITIGANSTVGGELFVFGHGGRIVIGDWCYVGEGTRIWSADHITVGDRVLISHGVNIHDCNSHPKDPEKRHAQFRAISSTGHPRHIEEIGACPVVIGEDAWIGFNSTILKGVTIGPRAIVAACSLVTRDVPAGGLQVGTQLLGSTRES